MTEDFHELSSSDLDEVSGGLSLIEMGVRLYLQLSELARQAAGMD